MELRRLDTGWQLTLIARDRSGLFASVAGTLSSFGMNILKAEAFANRRSLILDTFTFADPGRTLDLNPSEIDRLHATLEKVLGGFAAPEQPASETNSRPGVAEFDLHRLAGESGPGSELFFFPRLRAELQRHLQQAPRVLRFRGLRDCVKQLTGARRWGQRCQHLEGEIVAYLRQCLSASSTPEEFALMVE